MPLYGAVATDALAGSENVFPRFLLAVHVGEVDPRDLGQTHD
jgi:hypothetical protein